MQLTAEHAANQTVICEKGLHVWPSAYMASRCVQLHFMTGNTEQGLALLQTSLAAFRDPTDHAMLEDLSNKLLATPQKKQ